MILGQILRGSLDLLLPPGCICCGQGLAEGRSAVELCSPCRQELSALVSAEACPRCGHSLGPYASCGLCLDARPPMAATVRIGVFRGPLAQLIRAVKYRDLRYGVPLLADLLLAKLCQRRVVEDVDLVTAVPLHWWRFYRRGYNQASLLTRALRARGFNRPLERCLVRVRDTRPQVGLSRADRLANMRGAFRVRRSERVRGKRILLVDDVLTTGATAGTCARELLRHGARSVTVAVAAVAEGDRQTLVL